MFPLLHFFSPYPQPFFRVKECQKHSEEMKSFDSFLGLLICETKQNQNH